MTETVKFFPLVIDLDGTLILSDSLHESAIELLRFNPLYVILLPFWLLRGKAILKAEIAKRVTLDPQSLPYNRDFITWIEVQKHVGRHLVLCTATDQSVAKSIAQNLGIFDEVIASDGLTNVAGINKREALQTRFGHKGYDYAGNSSSDIPVWEGARQAIVVNATDTVLKAAIRVSDVTEVFPPLSRNATQWRKVFRVHQWLKNILLFVPLLAAHQMSNAYALEALILAFISFSACASSVYVTNDLLDLESDRKHPRKGKRPFASGAIPVLYGVFLAPILIIFSLILASIVGPAFLVWLLIYYFLTTAYSLKLKRLALIDCITLAGLYTLRIVAGGAAVDISLSFWLLACSIFIFLSLAFVKRYAELQVQASHGSNAAHGRGYLVSDAPLIQNLGVTSGYASVLVLALYLNSESVANLYATPWIIWMAIPLMVFWISWVWMQAHRGRMHDDPIVFAMKDKASLLVGLFMALTFVIASHWSVL